VWTCPPADDDALRDPGEYAAQPHVRRGRRNDLLVAVRDGVAEKDGAEPFDLDHDLLFEGSHQIAVVTRDPGRGPRGRAQGRLLGRAGIGSREALVEGRDDHPVGVAAHPADTVAHRFQTVEDLRGHRPRSHVTADDEQIEIDARQIRPHRFESRQVALHVIYRRDPRNLLHPSWSAVSTSQRVSVNMTHLA
jgi:hypothetical protein